MNLTKLFNYKYLLQNLKKSKGLLILISIIVPLFTSIMLISTSGDYVFDFGTLGIFNIIGMYIIPIALSITLFNYVYKKTSVDFIGSMPLSRKTIFVTNTIGGIAVIVLLQLFTLIATFILSKILSAMIFSAMVWDIFIFCTVGYIFVFTVSNLAMTISGNRFSQIAATLLILFLIPFLFITTYAYYQENNYYVYDTEYDTNGFEDVDVKIPVDDNVNFTIPNYPLNLFFDGYYYDGRAVIKTAILSIVYILLGLILFDRKKLELAGESYENENIHLVIKALTFVPFMAIFCALGDEKIDVALFFIAILAVYYFVFDLITNKKIKLRKSILAFIASAFIVFCYYEGVAAKIPIEVSKEIDLDDIKTVTIDSWGYRSSRSEFNLKIDDKDLIERIFAEDYNDVTIIEENSAYGTISNSSYSVVPDSNMQPAATDSMDSAPTVTTEEKINSGKYKYSGKNAMLCIKLNNGKQYYTSKYIYGNLIDEILTYADSKNVQSENKNPMLASIMERYNNSIPVLNGITLTKAQKDEILKLIRKEVDISYRELFEKYNQGSMEFDLNLYEYKNHKLQNNIFSSSGFKDINTYIINLYNNYVVRNINKINGFRFRNYNKLEEMIRAKNPSLFAYNENYNPNDGKYYYEYDTPIGERILDEINYGMYRELVESSMKEYIKQNANAEFDIDKDYISFISYGRITAYYYTNDIEGFYKIIAKKINDSNYYDVKLVEE